ncbi:Structural maintenance of chromosomes protein 5, partial [Gamsiella multidivaricata]
MARLEGTSKRRRDEDEDHGHAQSQDAVVPRSRITSTLHGVQDKTEYKNGAILKVSMKSFVTYEYCSFTPGPNLNMIIGPNGTGKSTIVLGRAKDISEFVKHGADKGWIEIVLCNRFGSNVAIKRHINKNNNTSVWKINGENKTQKDVMKKVQSFNIQVDNLCQFLPQDRVSEFAQMSPQELLKETQRAVGGEEMLTDHQRLIGLWNEHKTIAASMKGDLEFIETNMKRNQVIEKDVLRFQAREAVLKRVRLLEIWILYAKYGKAKDEYNEVKESRRVTFAMYKQLQTEVEPLQSKLSTMEDREKRCDDEKAVLDRQYQKSVHAMKTVGAAIEAVEGTGEELRKDMDRLHARAQQRQAAIANMKRKVAAQQELVDGAQSDEHINKEKDELHEKVMAIQEEVHDIKDKIDVLRSRQEDIVREGNSINFRLTEKRKRLEALDDIRNRRLQQLRSQDNDVYEAVLWLRQNREMFQKHVFEPVCLELNIKNMKFVNAIENILRNHLKTFVCQTRGDYDIFTRELLDKRRLRVNVIAPSPKELDLDNYSPPVPPNQLSRYGFTCYMLDAIDGPPALMATMCSKGGIHMIPVADTPNLDFQAIRESRKFKRYANSTTVYSVTYSKHTGEAMDTATQLRPAQIFTASVDHEERAQLIREVDQMRSTLEQNEGKVRNMSGEENGLRQAYQELQSKKNSLSDRRKELVMMIKQKEKNKIELE